MLISERLSQAPVAPPSLSRNPLDHECFQCGALDGVGCRDMSRGWEPYPVGIYHRTRILEARPEVRYAGC